MPSLPDCVDVLVTYTDGTTRLYEDMYKVGVHLKEVNELHMTPGGDDPEETVIRMSKIREYEILRPV